MEIQNEEQQRNEMYRRRGNAKDEVKRSEKRGNEDKMEVFA